MIHSILAAFILVGAATDAPVHENNLIGIKCIVSGKAINPACTCQFRKGELYFDCNASKLKYEANRKKYETKANHQLVVTRQYWQANCPISHSAVSESTGTQAQIAGAVLRFRCKHCLDKMLAEMDQSKQIERVFGSAHFEKTFQPRPTQVN